MKIAILAAVAAFTATAALADDGSDRFRGGAAAGALSASGFVNGPQSGRWSVGAMNSSSGFASLRETRTGVRISTGGGSTTEGFGANFRGFTGASGAGGGFGGFKARGRF